MKNSITAALVQQRPVYYDLPGSLQKMEHTISEAAGRGAHLIVFGETWLTGYPAWLDYLPKVALWDYEPTKRAFQMMYENAICVPGLETALLSKLAARHQAVIVVGVNEIIDRGPGSGTIFNSLLIFDEEGRLCTHHRKLMPTYTEKLLYGQGDGAGLQSVDTSFGKVGGLICWEHWMPLTRQTLHNDGEKIHVAVWPTVHDKHQLASRHYAFEGRCFVVAIGQILQFRDLPDFLRQEMPADPERYLLQGGSCVIGPGGEFLMEPVFEQDAVLYLEIPDLGQSTRERMTLDVTGHYQRPDVFQFEVSRKRTI